jgi:hypothetical protein
MELGELRVAIGLKRALVPTLTGIDCRYALLYNLANLRRNRPSEYGSWPKPGGPGIW